MNRPMLRAGAALALPLLLVVGCTKNPPTAASYDSFEAVASAAGCTLEPADPEPLAGAVASRACLVGVEGYTVAQYPDRSARDAGVDAGVVGGVSYLLLNDTWVLLGEPDAVVRVQPKFAGTVKLRASEPGDLSGDDPSTDEQDPATSAAEQVPLGDPATFEGEKLEVDKVRCGLDRLAKAAVSEHRYESSYDGPDYVTLRAARGMEFCRIDLEWKNVGKKPTTYFDAFDNIVTADGTEYTGDDSESGDAGGYLTALVNKWDYDSHEENDSNPGRRHKVVKVYSVPKGAKVTAALWQTDDDGNPLFAFQLR